MFHLINTQKKGIFNNQKYITDTPPKRRVFLLHQLTQSKSVIILCKTILCSRFLDPVLGGCLFGGCVDT